MRRAASIAGNIGDDVYISMQEYDKQNEKDFNSRRADAACNSLDSSVESSSVTGSQKPERKKWILLLLLLMFLASAQLIIILAGNGMQLPEQATANVSADRVENIKQVYEEFTDVMESLDSIESAEADPDVSNTEEAVIATDDKAADVTDESRSSEGSARAAAVKPGVITPVIKKPVKQQVTHKQTVLTPVLNHMPDNSPAVVSGLDEPISSGYIKHDNSGDVIDDNSEQWTCVHDDGTGLMWEVKSQDDSIRDSDNLYSWYTPENSSQPAAQPTAEQPVDEHGEPDGGRCKGGIDCDTYAYVQAMNKLNYCGHDDWQLPTREQMQTLVELKNSEAKVKINSHYFPNTLASWYWTASDEQGGDRAWYVLFRNGFALSDLKERPKHIRLVRKMAGGDHEG